ncbi:low specificity L-threonine aldolase [Alphaproteobacteria bacterium]|nr:low specificity L-threonine aldolase [Alphaproteobacteria bacterium]
MTNHVVNFASDNTAGAMPEVIDALTQAAAAPAMPYGDDPCTRRLGELANQVFEREVAIFPVATGTAANALSLASVSPPYGVVFCHEAAHIEEDECAAPEFYMGGGKLALLQGEGAKFSAESLRAKVEVDSPAPPVHHAQPAAVSITQATEVGALYVPDEIRAIAAICRDHGLALHMDGARLANAIAALDMTPAEVTWKAGVNVLSLGATKNGAFSAEAVVFFDPDKAGDFEFRRKRGGHLFSKMRFLSAQLVPYLEEGRWIANASNANRMAAALAKGLAEVEGVSLWFPAETNMLFVTMSQAMADKLQDAGCVFYSWYKTGGTLSARLVTSFETTPDDVRHFLEIAGKTV